MFYRAEQHLTAHRAAVDRAGGIGGNNVRLPVCGLLRLRCVLAVRKINKIVPCLLTQALVQLRQQSDIAFSAAVIGLDGIEIGVSRDQKRLPRACILHTAQQRSDRQHGAERDFQELFSAHRRHPPLFQIDLAALDAPPAEFFLPIADKDTFVKRFNEEKVCDREKTDESIRKIFDLPDAATGTDDEIIRCEDVKISYGNRTILKNFNWSVKRGEHWALSGENGAGKSTLLSLVCADNPQAYACNISLFGFKRGCGESIWDIKKKIGYVSPEMYRSYKKNLPAVDIVASGLHDSVGLYKRVTDEEREKVLFWMDIFGVGSLAQRPYLQLSSGEQRMLLLVRAFVKDPELLVLDEPFHGLDERRRMLARAVIDAFCKRKDKTLIMVTHYEEEYPASIDHKLKLKKIID